MICTISNFFIRLICSAIDSNPNETHTNLALTNQIDCEICQYDEFPFSKNEKECKICREYFNLKKHKNIPCDICNFLINLKHDSDKGCEECHKHYIDDKELPCNDCYVYIQSAMTSKLLCGICGKFDLEVKGKCMVPNKLEGSENCHFDCLYDQYKKFTLIFKILPGKIEHNIKIRIDTFYLLEDFCCLLDLKINNPHNFLVNNTNIKQNNESEIKENNENNKNIISEEIIFLTDIKKAFENLLEYLVKIKANIKLVELSDNMNIKNYNEINTYLYHTSNSNKNINNLTSLINYSEINRNSFYTSNSNKNINTLTSKIFSDKIEKILKWNLLIIRDVSYFNDNFIDMSISLFYIHHIVFDLRTEENCSNINLNKKLFCHKNLSITLILNDYNISNTYNIINQFQFNININILYISIININNFDIYCDKYLNFIKKLKPKSIIIEFDNIEFIIKLFENNLNENKLLKEVSLIFRLDYYTNKEHLNLYNNKYNTEKDFNNCNDTNKIEFLIIEIPANLDSCYYNAFLNIINKSRELKKLQISYFGYLPNIYNLIHNQIEYSKMDIQLNLLKNLNDIDEVEINMVNTFELPGQNDKLITDIICKIIKKTKKLTFYSTKSCFMFINGNEIYFKNIHTLIFQNNRLINNKFIKFIEFCPNIKQIEFINILPESNPTEVVNCKKAIQTFVIDNIYFNTFVFILHTFKIKNLIIKKVNITFRHLSNNNLNKKIEIKEIQCHLNISEEKRTQQENDMINFIKENIELKEEIKFITE